MIRIRKMELEEYRKIKEIDRSEQINLIYVNQGDSIVEQPAGHECPTWNQAELKELEERFQYELKHGGLAIGAFDGEKLAGFGVLAHRLRGPDNDRIQVDLMYVSRAYRRQGIGSRIIQLLSDEARHRGAKYLYISSTETESAVQFYHSCGSKLTRDKDPDLFEKEPHDIHMIIAL
ncbi:GNAT family N-acetyltransferase [Paenibacillus thiaminolyticus]|uniref:GNAT family N-acetyltransferase n=1 Tax=Paenibacillus thiaminolyticus TaxID=49283 RepID=A0A3A3GK38_PANTH|nr:GNAT family N-acetyltransferase [Paenibacillus thiaminolyticus]RJG23631.1 GNAT family N-acetyltransferase [Paenibacillus thiaminolyticus]